MRDEELKAIYHSINCTQDIIACLAWPEYPYGQGCDAELTNMYYRLNDMLLAIAKKREALRAKERGI